MKYPKGETVWVSYFDKAWRLRFFLTSKPARDYYYMYEVKEDGSYVKLGKSKSSPELEERFKIDERTGIDV